MSRALRPMRIGVLVNPVAGLGGAVALKGTDGPGTVAEALARGAVPQAGVRFRQAMAALAEACPGTPLCIGPGPLGLDHVTGLPLAFDPVAVFPLTGTARDTGRAVRAIGPLDLLVVAGGDGTLRDAAAEIPPGAGLLGIPSGVKMHSAAFARSPATAGRLLADLVSGRVPLSLTEAEVMDIDEEALRRGLIAPRLHGLVLTPRSALVQPAKGRPRGDGSADLRAAGAEVARGLGPGTLAVIGPGRGAATVLGALGLDGTLLGVDAVREGALVGRDLTGRALDGLVQAHAGPVVLVMGVTGGQGFLFGRGNQQIGPRVIARAGRAGLVVLAEADKLAGLVPPVLWIDLPDPGLAATLEGHLRVRTGAGRSVLMRIAAA
ncbi:MAG: ATP-NAD kinase family protein [Gemmobacter sp.]